MKTIYIKRNDLFKNINMVMCNNIATIDPDFIEDNMHLYEVECEECHGTGLGEGDEDHGEACDNCHGNYMLPLEVYQTFLCNIDDYTKQSLESWGVSIGFSELLQLHVIAIYDFGTSWGMFSYSKDVADDYDVYGDETETRQTVY